MNKESFLAELRSGLSGLPQADVEERLSFYGEMIDDRVEEGMSEEEAVAGIGPVDEVVKQTVADVPLTKIVKEKVNSGRKLRGWEIALLILGFPLWFPLLIAAAAVALSLYVVLWSLIVTLWAVEISLWAGALAGIVSAVVHFVRGNTIPGIAMLGIAAFCAGASVFMFYGCVAATKGLVRLTKKMALGLKSLIIGKERSK